LQTALAAKEAQQKKFAYIAIAAVLLFSGYVVYRFMQTRKLSKRLEISLVELKQAQEQLIRTEKEKEAENIRVRISRDIHDEVGATLSGVALFSEIAREKMKQHKEEDAQVYLEHITANSKEMVDKMSDIVWAINPDNDNFDRIIAKLQSYAFNLCAGKGISFQVDIDDKIREHFPPMQVKRNLYLFLKEAINNAVKYSEGNNIYLSLQKVNDLFIAEIRDDGKGFDSSLHRDGNGIKNMKARADILEGTFDIASAQNKGTTVRLQFHFHPAGGHLQGA
jgi:signal transduction histidine kinase